MTLKKSKMKKLIYEIKEYINNKFTSLIFIKRNYKNTRKELIKILKKNKNISYQEWNEYAYKNGYFSAIVIMDHEDVDKWEDLIKKLKY